MTGQTGDGDRLDEAQLDAMEAGVETGAFVLSPRTALTLIRELRDTRAENRRLIAALEKRNAPPDDERLARMLDRAQRQANSRPWRAVGRLVRQVQAVTVERDQLRAELAAERAKVQRVSEALTNRSAVRAEYVLKLLAGDDR